MENSNNLANIKIVLASGKTLFPSSITIAPSHVVAEGATAEAWHYYILDNGTYIETKHIIWAKLTKNHKLIFIKNKPEDTDGDDELS